MEQEVRIPPLGLPGVLALPPAFAGVVVFAHGNGSDHRSPRNRHTAAALREAGFGTLLFDLLTAGEAQDPVNIADVHLQAERLIQATRFVHAHTGVDSLPIGYFGAATGAAAALIAAARLAEHDHIAAVVARGGRPDLAEVWLDGVSAPTLLLVGATDTPALEANRQALARLHGAKALEIIPGAGHWFEEPGTLDLAIDAARSWFATHLAGQSTGEGPAQG